MESFKGIAGGTRLSPGCCRTYLEFVYPSRALCVDIGKENAGTVSGTMNMAGNLGSFLTALAFPYITDWTGSVDYFFYTAAFLNVVCDITKLHQC